MLILDGDFKQYNKQLLAIAKRHHIPVWPDGQSKEEGPVIWDEVLSKGFYRYANRPSGRIISYLKQKGLR